MKLKIGDKTFTVKVAKSDESKKTGLIPVKPGSMPKDAGLVLKYDVPTSVNITMKGMQFPIDIIFVSGEAVQKIVSAEPGQENISINDLSDYVVEVPKGSAEGLKSGDTSDWVGEKSEDGTIEKAEGGVIASDEALQLLDENGKVQTNIEGDERIFSRKHTARLLALAEKSAETKQDNDYRKLGMAMIQMINKQDTQEQQYTEV